MHTGTAYIFKRSLLNIKPSICNFFAAVKPAFFLFIPVIFLSCEAPRSNPIDPMNGINSNLASIEGTVRTLSIPYIPLKGARVIWVPGNLFLQTDEEGKFLIQNIQPDDGLLIIEKEGYLSDTIRVLWENSKKISKDVNLNKLPELDSISVYTVIINQTAPEINHQLFIIAKISDADNDIDSVQVRSDPLNIEKTMNYDVDKKSYKVNFVLSELKINDLEEITGHEFDIIVNDIFGNTFKIGSEKVSRVIKNQVNIISPANGSVADSLPELKWDRFSSGYFFNYTIEIYTNDPADAQLAARISGISKDSTSYKLNQPLPANEYFWVLWIVDEFYNRSRSKPATFVVL